MSKLVRLTERQYMAEEMIERKGMTTTRDESFTTDEPLLIVKVNSLKDRLLVKVIASKNNLIYERHKHYIILKN